MHNVHTTYAQDKNGFCFLAHLYVMDQTEYLLADPDKKRCLLRAFSSDNICLHMHQVSQLPASCTYRDALLDTVVGAHHVTTASLHHGYFMYCSRSHDAQNCSIKAAHTVPFWNHALLVSDFTGTTLNRNASIMAESSISLMILTQLLGLTCGIPRRFSILDKTQPVST